MKGFYKIKKIWVIILSILTLVLSTLVIVEGINNLITQDYLSLGDPFHKSDILAFQRAPVISRFTLVILALVFVDLLFGLKKDEKKL